MKKQATVFVFGSNLQGIHGKGAALTAVTRWGARRGLGEGLAGKSYALPTKQSPYRSLPIADVRTHVDRFLEVTRQRPDLQFLLTKIGCGLAGFRESAIAEMFVGAPDNVMLVDETLQPLCKAQNWAQHHLAEQLASALDPGFDSGVS